MKNLFQIVFGTQGKAAQKAFRLPALAGIGVALAVLLLAGCSTGNYDNVSPIAGTWTDEDQSITFSIDNATWSAVKSSAKSVKYSGWYTLNAEGKVATLASTDAKTIAAEYVGKTLTLGEGGALTLSGTPSTILGRK